MRRTGWFIAILLVALHARAAAPRIPVKPKLGQSYNVAGWWFQFLGDDGQDGRVWLYPHFDGVCELFRVSQGRTWVGDLGSCFNPRSGVFENTFNGAEVLNEFLAKDATLSQRQEAAKLLSLWLVVHPADEVPYYARGFVENVGKYLSPEARTWGKKQLALRKRLKQRVGSFGIKVPALQKPMTADRGPQEYYRRMLSDGYLDIAVVGGNLRDNSRGTYHSWKYMEELQTLLQKEHRFKFTGFRRATDETLGLLQKRMLGQSVTVRINVTGGSMRESRIMRAVANFVEGLAHTDLFIYHGHSNYSSGSYYISEADTPWSRFQIGLRNQKDLAAKCHLLRTKAHQLICFQSCSSYRKYVQPIRWHYARTWPKRSGRAGFMGTSERSWFVDFVPRYGKLIELVLKGEGAQTIQDALNAIQPKPTSPPMILRGFLQSPASFILPEGVKVANLREGPVQQGHQVLGDGSDGRTYHSTEVFAQNYAGEIVQVAAVRSGLYGLTKDGRVYFCGRSTRGSALASNLSAEGNMRFKFIGTRSGLMGTRLILVGSDGRIYRQDDRSRRPCLAHEQPPEHVFFNAIGENNQRQLIGRDDKGRWYAWDGKLLQFTEKKKTPEPNWEPSLLGYGTKGVLYLPGGLPVTPVKN